VVQGTDAGGHQWAKTASLITLLPEVIDMLADEFPGSHVQVIAAGGIMDGRGVAAAMVLGRLELPRKDALLIPLKEQMEL
jgi:nitronate monooxygenase